MVKHINETFDDEVFEKLEAVKGDRPWNRAIIEEFGVDDDE